MSFIDKLKNIFRGNGTSAISLNNGMTPLYSQYGQNIFSSDVVMQAVNCIILEIIKLKPTHIKKIGSDIIPQNGNIQNILNCPNELMTTSDFIEKVMWNYYFNSNSFIIPKYYKWDENGTIKRHYEGLYPVRPSQVDFIQDASDKYYVKMYFANGVNCTLPYEDIIHLRREFSIDDYMGGDLQGQPNNKGLQDTLTLNKNILDSIAKSLNASTKINGIIKIKTYLKSEAMEKEIANFNTMLENNESGILPLDSSMDYQALARNIKLVDSDTLKFIDEKILRTFGIPLTILTGDYTKEQYEAFYQKTLEPLVIKLSQNFTKVLFTQREKSFGNSIAFYPEELVFLNRQQAIEVIKELGQTGTLYENEKRQILGLKPLKELEGKRLQSLNFVDSSLANEYQLGDVNGGSANNTDNNNNDNNNSNNNNDNNDNNEEQIKEGIKMRMRGKNMINEKNAECRNYNFEVRAKKDDKHGTYIEGKPIVYGDKYDCEGMFEETIDEGALNKTDLKDVRLLVNHNIDMIPLARSRNNNENSSMQLKVESDGLSIRANLDIENNADAKALYSAIERGDITGMSFMFSVGEEEWVDLKTEYPKRHIKSISKVYEVSAVTFPAYENTSIKARSKSVLENARSNSTDDELQALENVKTELELEKLKAKLK